MQDSFIFTSFVSYSFIVFDSSLLPSRLESLLVLSLFDSSFLCIFAFFPFYIPLSSVLLTVFIFTTFRNKLFPRINFSHSLHNYFSVRCLFTAPITSKNTPFSIVVLFYFTSKKSIIRSEKKKNIFFFNFDFFSVLPCLREEKKIFFFQTSVSL